MNKSEYNANHPEFYRNQLNEHGKKEMDDISRMFDNLLENLFIRLWSGREYEICKLKLEEACFYAHKSLHRLDECCEQHEPE